MSFAYNRISSFDTSHDQSAYLAEIVCRSSTQTRNTLFEPIMVRRSRNIY